MCFEAQTNYLFKLKFRIYLYHMTSLTFCSGQAARWKPELCSTVQCARIKLSPGKYVHHSRRVSPVHTESTKSQKEVQVTLEELEIICKIYLQN